MWLRWRPVQIWTHLVAFRTMFSFSFSTSNTWCRPIPGDSTETFPTFWSTFGPVFDTLWNIKVIKCHQFLVFSRQSCAIIGGIVVNHSNGGRITVHTLGWFCSKTIQKGQKCSQKSIFGAKLWKWPQFGEKIWFRPFVCPSDRKYSNLAKKYRLTHWYTHQLPKLISKWHQNDNIFSLQT